MTKCNSVFVLPHPASCWTDRTVIGVCRPNTGMDCIRSFNFSVFNDRRFPSIFMSAILISCTSYDGWCVTGDLSAVFLVLGFSLGPQFVVMVVTFFFRCLSRFRSPWDLAPKPLLVCFMFLPFGAGINLTNRDASFLRGGMSSPVDRRRA